ncbi:Os01g0967700, partial [Oryza sativa Japonica Group]
AGVTRRPITPRRGTVLNKVADLIDPATGWWDKPLVEEIFWESDARNILAIPVRLDTNDFVAWHFDTRGMYSVKSAYHVLEDQRERSAKKQEGGSSSGAVNQRNFEWDKIWSLQCIPKVKQFIWRLAHNSLPLKLNIKRRVPDAETLCPVCKRFDENGGHCFLQCKPMKLCWRILCLEDIRLSLTQLVSARDVVQTILKLENDRRMEVFFLLWVWWYARNKVNSGEDVIRVEEVVHKVKQLICDHASLRKGKHPKVNVQRNKWVPPVDGNLKLNFDGAFRAVNKSGGYDFLVRDHRGCAVLAGAGCLEHVHDAFAAEAEAGLAGLKSAISHGINSVQVETDSPS